MTLKGSGLQSLTNYAQIEVSTFGDIFKYQEMGLPSISLIAREHGRETVIDCIKLALIDLQSALNLVTGLNEFQFQVASEAILNEYPNLTPADLKKFVIGAVIGKYGQHHSRIDVQILFGWLKKYFDERLESAENYSMNQHKAMKTSEKLSLETARELRERFYGKDSEKLFNAIKENSKKSNDSEFHRIKAEYYRSKMKTEK